jgi:hypothetical protein
VHEGVAAARFELARTHSEHRNPVLAHEPGGDTVELLPGEGGIDVCGQTPVIVKPGISANTPPALTSLARCLQAAVDSRGVRHN